MVAQNQFPISTKPLYNLNGDSEMTAIVDQFGYQIGIVTAVEHEAVAKWLAILMNDAVGKATQ